MSPTAHGEVVVVALLHQHPEPGTVVRVARTALNWSQAELGRRCGYSASQVSRWETGRLPLRDVELLRMLADVLALPPAVFGLGDLWVCWPRPWQWPDRSSPPAATSRSRRGCLR